MSLFRTPAFTRCLVAVLGTSALFSCGSGTSGSSQNGSAGAAVAGAESVGGEALGGGSSAGAAGLSSGGAAGSALAGFAGLGGVGGASGGGHAGMGGAAGAGGSSASVCPAAAPSNAAACSAALQGNTCYYDDCSGLGRRTRAICVFLNAGTGSQGMWSVNTFPCGESVQCDGDGSGHSCPVGQACVVMQGGALITQCAEHSCGNGPIECSCVESCVPGCTKQGFTFTCSTRSDPRGCP